jgi:hypothetical protein
MPRIIREYSTPRRQTLGDFRYNDTNIPILETYRHRRFEIGGIEGVNFVVIYDLDNPQRPSWVLRLGMSDMEQIDQEISRRLQAELGGVNYVSEFEAPATVQVDPQVEPIRAQAEGRVHRPSESPAVINPYYEVEIPEHLDINYDRNVMDQFMSQYSRNVENSLFAQLYGANLTPAPTSKPKIKRKERLHSLMTWMPYSNYTKCAECFATRDLKEMRNTVCRVLKYLQKTNPVKKIRSAELWRGYEQSLLRYGIAIAIECRNRNLKDTSLEFFKSQLVSAEYTKPDWVYWSRLQDSHREYLLLREERRLLIHRYRQAIKSPTASKNWASHRDLCLNIGVNPSYKWSMHDIQCIYHYINLPRHLVQNVNHYKHFKEENDELIIGDHLLYPPREEEVASLRNRASEVFSTRGVAGR